MPYDQKRLGHWIRALREERGMTQEVLSGLSALSRSHLAEIEGGGVRVSVDTLWRIAEALDVRPSELLRRIEDADPP